MAFLAALLLSSVSGAIISPRVGHEKVGYTLQQNWTGSNFFNYFDFFTDNDPTHGYVNYVSYNDALNQGLIKAGTPTYIGADHTNIASGRGRNSVRISSKSAFTYGLFIIDLLHMPSGCGTWPAFWTVGPNWPNSGEIDIIEGVDKQTDVLTTLHTSDGCDQSSEPTSAFTGHWSTGSQGNPSDNCYVNAPDQYSNQGCSIVGPGNSFGAPFNSQNGGVYATQWASTGIYMWYWTRNAIPSDIKSNNPDPRNWGLPYAAFTFGASCNANHFQNHNVVFDLTFCGDWDGSVFGSDCPGLGSCNSYVQNNPSAFDEAYWLINYVQVYE